MLYGRRGIRKTSALATAFALAFGSSMTTWASAEKAQSRASRSETPFDRAMAPAVPKALAPSPQLAASLRSGAYRAPHWSQPGLEIDNIDRRRGKIWGHASGAELLSLVTDDGTELAVHGDGSFEATIPQGDAQELRLLGLFPGGRQGDLVVPLTPCGEGDGLPVLEPDHGAPHSQCIRAGIGGVIEYQGLRLRSPRAP